MSIEPLHNPGQPTAPNRVREIVRLHDAGETFDEIAKRLGGSRMNACKLYNRWRDWAYQEKKTRKLAAKR